MSNRVISFHPENRPSSASKIHPPVINKCRRFSTGSCKRSHTDGGALPLFALCSMLLFLLFCLLLLTLTGNRLHQEVLAYTIAPKSLQIHVIDNWWGVLYPPAALSGGVVPEENTKNQSADSVSDALISDNEINWMSQKKYIFFDMFKNKKDTALISSKTDPMACSNHSELSGTASTSKTTTEPSVSSSNSKPAATHTVSADSNPPDKAHASSDNSITLRVTCRFLSFLPGGSER